MATVHKKKNEIAKASHIPALGDTRLHADSGMPDKRPLSASGDHVDTDFPDKDYTPSSVPNLRPLPDKSLEAAAHRADDVVSKVANHH